MVDTIFIWVYEDDIDWNNYRVHSPNDKLAIYCDQINYMCIDKLMI